MAETFRPVNTPRPKPKKKQDPLAPPTALTAPDGTPITAPPYMSYDPALDAAARAAWRGYQDIEQDFGIQRKIDRQDLRQTRTDIRQDYRRGRQDLRTDKRRGLIGVRQERQDINRTARRSEQDFNIRLGDLFRKYGIQSNVQAQQANSQGVASGGTLAASAQARAANAGRDLGTLTLARSRASEDTATALERLALERKQMLQDVGRSGRRLKQDTKRSRELAKRDFSRARRAARLELNRAEREAIIAQSDYGQQAIWNARQLHPNVYNKYGEKTGGNKKGTGGRKDGKKRKPQKGGFRRA